MAQNITLMGASYSAVPAVTLPKTGGGTATFTDTSDATLNNGNKMLSGNTAYSNGTKYTGSISSKSAQTYTPTTTNQTIASGQYLTGTQTIKGDANLLAENIKKDVSIFSVVGTYEGGGGGSAWTDVSSLISYSSAFASTVFAIKSNSYFVALIDCDGENSSDTEFYISLPFQLRYSNPGVDIVGILQTAEAPYDAYDYAYYYDATTIMCSISVQANMTALICAKLR